MCVALFVNKDIPIKKAVLKECFKNNPDGAGFAYPSANGKQVFIEKGFFHFRAFWERFRSVKGLNRPMIIHFRVATSGIVDKDNCHPWRIDSSHAMIHNGVIQGKLGLQADNCSDTGLFVEHVLKPTFKENSNIWKTDGYKWAMQEAIGSKNKVVILDASGFSVIFNEKEGIWEDGIWFSNETFKTARKTTAKIGDSWIEERANGGRWQVTRKNGIVNYKPITNSLEVRETNDSKIMRFASRATGVAIGQNSMTSLITKNINVKDDSKIETLTTPPVGISSEVDVAQMF